MLASQAQPQRLHANLVIFNTLIHINIMLILQTPRDIYYYHFTCFLYFKPKTILSDFILQISHPNYLLLLSHFSFYLEQYTNQFWKRVMRAKISRMIKHEFSNYTSSNISIAHVASYFFELAAIICAVLCFCSCFFQAAVMQENDANHEIEVCRK